MGEACNAGGKSGEFSDGLPTWEQFCDRLVCDFCQSLGWTPDYCESQLTYELADSFFEYWVDHPPLHKLYAAYIGYKSTATNKKQSGTYAELIQMFPDGKIAGTI